MRDVVLTTRSPPSSPSVHPCLRWKAEQTAVSQVGLVRVANACPLGNLWQSRRSGSGPAEAPRGGVCLWKQWLQRLMSDSELSSSGRARPGPSAASSQTAAAAALTGAGHSMVVVSSANPPPLSLSLTHTHHTHRSEGERLINYPVASVYRWRRWWPRLAAGLLLFFLTCSLSSAPVCLQPCLSSLNASSALTE